MSTAANHRQRSHRSCFRARPFNSEAKRSVIKPTAPKLAYFNWFKLLRKSFTAPSKAEDGE